MWQNIALPQNLHFFSLCVGKEDLTINNASVFVGKEHRDLSLSSATKEHKFRSLSSSVLLFALKCSGLYVT